MNPDDINRGETISQFGAELVIISTDLNSTRRLQDIRSKIATARSIFKEIDAEKAQFWLRFAQSLNAIQERHGLLVLYGPIPHDAESYDVTILLGSCDKKPESSAGFGYGLLFDTRNFRAAVQFGDTRRVFLESDIFELFSIYRTGLPHAPRKFVTFTGRNIRLGPPDPSLQGPPPEV